MTKLVIFDLDGTIIPNPSSEKLFLFWLIVHRYIGIKQIWQAALFIFKWFFHFKDEIFVRNKAYLYDLPVDKITTAARSFTTQKLLPKIRAEMRQKIEKHHAAADIVILLTGTLEPIAQIFAEHLKFDEYYSNQCVIRDNRFTNSPPTQQPYREEKLTITQKICAKHKIAINTITTYANSIHDLHLLEAVGAPITVTPDKKLRRIARERGWEIMECKNAINN